MMIDVEETLRAELDRLVPVPAGPSWDEVLQLAGHANQPIWRRRTRSAAIIVAVAGAATVLTLATPLGAAIARSLSGFSTWISGEPGSPAPKAEQRAFARANARTWLGFPAGTKLRLLDNVTDPTTGERVELLGFRSGGTLCLRVHLIGTIAGTGQSCAPLAELRQAGAPVRVVLVDNGFGSGKHRAWYGLDRVHSSALQVTAGIAADGVRTVTLTDQAGTHTVRTDGNAFLYVAWNPAVGQRVKQISAQTASGRVAVPFAQAPFLFGAGGGAAKPSFGPTSVQRHITGGTIGWLDHRQPKGQPLSVLPKRAEQFIFRHAVFGRVIAPDPGQPIRVAVALSTSRHGGKAIGVCTDVIVHGAAGGGCAVRARLFARGPLAGPGTMLVNGSDEFAIVDGLASDDVAKIVAFLANRQTQPVPLADNVYAVQIARAKLPAKLVAYDNSGRIVGITTVDEAPAAPAPRLHRAGLSSSCTSPRRRAQRPASTPAPPRTAANACTSAGTRTSTPTARWSAATRSPPITHRSASPAEARPAYGKDKCAPTSRPSNCASLTAAIPPSSRPTGSSSTPSAAPNSRAADSLTRSHTTPPAGRSATNRSSRQDGDR
jgi:hypothetical protein